jgi:hypothetical protein
MITSMVMMMMISVNGMCGICYTIGLTKNFMCEFKLKLRFEC